MGNGKLEGKLVVFLWRNAGVTCHELKSRSRGVGIFHETMCFGIRNVSEELHMVSPGSLAGLYSSKGIYASVFLSLGPMATPLVSLELRYAHGHEWRAEDKWNGSIFFTENIESAGVCLFQHFKPKAKKRNICALLPRKEPWPSV